MPDPTISNTSPIYYLHRLDHLDLLEKIYGEIVIPNGFWKNSTKAKRQVCVFRSKPNPHSG
jgi:predicted nucleic acid-binding protein